MRGCHDQLAYELLYAGRRGSKCCFQSATRSRTERPEREPSPLPGSSDPLSSEARPADTRKQDAGDFPRGVETPRNRVPSNRPIEPCIDPLYLFACGLSWRTHSNTTAGWELVRCLRSSGQDSRIAAALLAQAENIRPLGAPVRASDAPPQAPLRREAGPPRAARWWL